MNSFASHNSGFICFPATVAFFILISAMILSSCGRDSGVLDTGKLSIYVEGDTTEGERFTPEVSDGNRGQPEPEGLTVDIASYFCPGGERESLLAFDSYHHNMFIYSSDEYTVLWEKDGTFFQEGVRLECVCSGNYTAKVIQNPDGVTGIDTHWVECE